MARLGRAVSVKPGGTRPLRLARGAYRISSTLIQFTRTRRAWVIMQFSLSNRTRTAGARACDVARATISCRSSTRKTATFVDGQIRAHRSRARRRQIAYVSQSRWISFIHENIDVKRPDEPRRDACRAAQLANATDTIDRLPGRVDTRRENAAHPAARQRSAIARAIPRDALSCALILYSTPKRIAGRRPRDLMQDAPIAVWRPLPIVVASTGIAVLATAIGGDGTHAERGGRHAALREPIGAF